MTVTRFGVTAETAKTIGQIDEFLREHPGSTRKEVSSHFGLLRGRFEELRRKAYTMDIAWTCYDNRKGGIERRFGYWSEGGIDRVIQNTHRVLKIHLGEERSNLIRVRLQLEQGDDAIVDRQVLINAITELEVQIRHLEVDILAFEARWPNLS